MTINKLDFDQFMNQARIKLTGASDAGIKAELYDTLREFFEDSNCWTELLDVNVQVGVRDYLLNPLQGGMIIRLVSVIDKSFFPIAAFMPVLGTLTLLNAPSQTSPPGNPYTVKVVETVKLPTTKDMIPIIPDWVFPMYGIHILDGLLGRMMSQPNKSFSNATMAVYHLKRFRTGIQIARTAAQRENLVGAQSWAFPNNFRTEGQRGGVVTAWPPAGRPL